MKRIILTQPVYRHYLWGGEKLRRFAGVEPESPLAESWEVSCRSDGMCLDRETGETLESVWHSHCDGEFPLLIKFIDAAKDLSVQVHPDDAFAHSLGLPFGKSECWYIVEAEPGAKLALGLKAAADKETLRSAAQDGSLADYLNWIEPKAGECYFIPAGTIHALGAGLTVAEIQQNSDTTYRLYDYGRLDTDGKPRQLHLEQALACADLNVQPVRMMAHSGTDPRIVCETDHFRVISGNNNAEMRTDADFAIVMAIDSARVQVGDEAKDLPAGQSCLIFPEGEAVRINPEGEFLWILPGGAHA